MVQVALSGEAGVLVLGRGAGPGQRERRIASRCRGIV